METSKNICFVTSQVCFPPTDGGKQGLYYRINEISKRNNVYCAMYDGGNNFSEEDCRRWLPNTKCLLIKPTEVDIKNLGTLKKIIYGVKWLLQRKSRWEQMLKRNESLENLIIGKDIDIVVFEGPFPSLLVSMDVIRTNVNKIVLVEHNIEHEYIIDSIKLPKRILEIESNRIRKLEEKLIKYVDEIICVSPYDAVFFKKKFKGPVRYLPSVLQKKNQSWVLNDSKYIVFNGSLSFLPNREGMIWFIEKVLSKVLDKYPMLKVKITGKLDTATKRRFEKNKAIEFTGFLSSNELEKVILNCEFAVVPVFRGAGVKIKLLELLSYGVPVLTTQVCKKGCTENRFSEKAFLFSDRENEWVEYVEKLLEKKHFKVELSNRARNYYESSYSGEQVINEWNLALKEEI